MLEYIQRSIGSLFRINSFKNRRTRPTDESQKRLHLDYHERAIDYFIDIASKKDILLDRTYDDDPKGDSCFKNTPGAIEFAPELRLRYFKYSRLDLADLADIEFRNRVITRIDIAKKVIAQKNNCAGRVTRLAWYVTTGSIAPSALLEFQTNNISCLEYTSKQDVLDYLNCDR